MDDATGLQAIVPMSGGKLQPPEDGWGDRLYLVAIDATSAGVFPGVDICS